MQEAHYRVEHTHRNTFIVGPGETAEDLFRRWERLQEQRELTRTAPRRM